MPKAVDREIEALKALALNEGWKRHAWYVFRWSDDRTYIVSASIKRLKLTGRLQARIELHSVELNQISHFMHDDWRAPSGLFAPRKLAAGRHLNDFRACGLFAADHTIDLDGDPAIAFRSIVDAARSSLDRYGSIDALQRLYEGRDVFSGPLLCIRFAKGDVAGVRELLRRDGFTEASGGGDVRYGIMRYLTANGL